VKQILIEFVEGNEQLIWHELGHLITYHLIESIGLSYTEEPSLMSFSEIESSVKARNIRFFNSIDDLEYFLPYTLSLFSGCVFNKLIDEKILFVDCYRRVNLYPNIKFVLSGSKDAETYSGIIRSNLIKTLKYKEFCPNPKKREELSVLYLEFLKQNMFKKLFMPIFIFLSKMEKEIKDGRFVVDGSLMNELNSSIKKSITKDLKDKFDKFYKMLKVNFPLSKLD
jgi:hypothetical protein